MKHLLVLVVMVTLGFATASAQSCSGHKAASCSKEKAAACHGTAAAEASLETMTASNVEKRIAKDGTVSYVRKSVCEHSGTTSYTNVVYDASTGKFVDAPKEKGACCSKSAGAKACPGASTSTTSSKPKA